MKIPLQFKVTLGLPVLAATLLATSAQADPCKAVPDKGATPSHLRPGARFTGLVTYVGDGDSFCVARGITEEDWVEVRLADYYAPELNAPGGSAAKDALRRIVMGKRVGCVAGRRSYDRIVAKCQLDGRDIAVLLRKAGVQQGGKGWR